jgi:hypothetical protein
MHFTADIWLELTGIDIRVKVEYILNNKFKSEHLDNIEKLNLPVTPCIALMKRLRSTPHMGVFINGSIIHLTEIGVECLPVNTAMRGFNHIRYFR